MKKIGKILIWVLVFFAVILIYSWFRTVIDKTNLLVSFDKTFSLVIQNIWEFISIPTIFISLIILIVCWNFRDPINHFFTKIKELKYKDFSAAIDFEDSKNFEYTQVTNPNNNEQIISKISFLGKRTTTVFLEIGDKILNLDELIEIIKKNGLLVYDSKTGNTSFSNGYYYGIYSFMKLYFLSELFDMEISEDRKQAKFNYKPNVKSLLEKRNKELNKSIDK